MPRLRLNEPPPTPRPADQTPSSRLTPSSSPSRPGLPLRQLVASGASGVLLWSAFPPLDLGPVALVALVPLLWAWRDATPRRAALYGFVFGIVFFGLLLEWTRYFGAVAIVPLVLAVGAYMAVTGLVVGGLTRIGMRSAWLTAAAWVVFEAGRGRWPLGGLPWGEVGVALHDLPVARHLASVGGVALVSFVVVAVNGLLLDVLVGAREHAPRPVAFAGVGLAGIVIVSAAASGFRSEPTPTGELRVAMLQGNDQNRDLSTSERETYLPESHFGLAEGLDGDYDLIVFPESSLGGRNPEAEDEEELRARIVDLARDHDAQVLVNGLVPVPDDDSDFNTNYVYDPDGSLQGTYAKQHLVPFGEYVPFRSALGWIDALERVPTDYEPGAERRLFEIGGRPVATEICFESAFASISRANVRDGAEAIVVTTNNRSYRRSANSAQHIALSQMRAAETGRPVLHASISGITGVIDAEGDLSDTTELFERTVVTGTVTTTTGQTPFVRYGEWVLWGSAVALIVAIAVGYSRQRAAAKRARL